jgi:hypothetical protein
MAARYLKNESKASAEPVMTPKDIYAMIKRAGGTIRG